MTPTERERKRRRIIEWHLVVNSYPCTKCGVPPGRSCRTDMGHISGQPHAERSQIAAARGWAFADADPRCARCHRGLDGEHPQPGLCKKCAREVNGPPPTHATREHPGPDGSYDAPLFGEDS